MRFCDIVIDKKYMYLIVQMTKTYFSNISGLYLQSGNPWNFLIDKSSGASFVIIFGLPFLVPDIASEPSR